MDSKRSVNGIPAVYVMATGGTLANTTNGRIHVGGVIRSIPQLKKLAKVEVDELVRVNSNSLTLEHWLEMANRINSVLRRRDIAGVVVTHGSNSLEETAYFLNLTVKSRKPVVITAAQRKFGTIGSDSEKNLLDAFLVALSKDARGKGVLAVANEEIHAARDVTKMMSHRVNTYHSHDFGILGLALKGNISFYRSPIRIHTADSEFEIKGLTSLPRVEIVYSYQAATGDLLQAVVEKLKPDGIVIASFPTGNATPGINDMAKTVSGFGIPIVMANRGGRDQLHERSDWISGDTLNPQKARILLMLALTRSRKPAAIQRMFREY